MNPTRVVSVRGLDPAAVAAAGVVYVGRPYYRRCGFGRADCLVYPGHALGNPFKLVRKPSQAAARECVRRYADWLYSDPARVALAESLRGAALGCWCGEWSAAAPGDRLACHAVVIARVAEGMSPIPQSWGEPQ